MRNIVYTRQGIGKDIRRRHYVVFTYNKNNTRPPYIKLLTHHLMISCYYCKYFIIVSCTCIYMHIHMYVGISAHNELCARHSRPT